MKLGIGLLLDLLDFDMDDIVETGEEYIIGQVLDLADGLSIARRLGLLPQTWRAFKQAGRKLAGYVKEHGTVTEEVVQGLLAAP